MTCETYILSFLRDLVKDVVVSLQELSEALKSPPTQFLGKWDLLTLTPILSGVVEPLFLLDMF